jgi:hypothetical protein
MSNLDSQDFWLNDTQWSLQTDQAHKWRRVQQNVWSSYRLLPQFANETSQEWLARTQPSAKQPPLPWDAALSKTGSVRSSRSRAANADGDHGR